MVYFGFNQRLKDLEDNITQDLELLKEYEDALRYAENPRIIRGYHKEVERQEKSIKNYKLQYAELKKQELAEESSKQIQDVGNKLQVLDEKVNILLSGQVAIYQDINQMRQALLERYDEGEQAIINAIAQQLDESQLALTQRLLEAVEANQISQPEMQQMLAVLEKRIPSLPPSQATTVEIIKNPELDAKHKLKVTLPLVPLLVNYEGELVLGAGLNVKSAWEKLVNKLRGE
ncbi:MAG: hypothetical protein SXA11_01195 [Cyanobacteriota bacterium]|nr:hypothetical protein [Cyanobacteriota bacterium]